MIENVLYILFIGSLAALIILFGKTKILDKVTEYINLAEDYSTVGSEKFNWCVSQLRSLLPGMLRAIFTDEVVGKIVENAYQNMRDLVKKRIVKLQEEKIETESKK